MYLPYEIGDEVYFFVNPIVIGFDPAKPGAERTYPLSAIGIDVSK